MLSVVYKPGRVRCHSPLVLGGRPLGFVFGAIAEVGLYSSAASPFSEAKGEPASEPDLSKVNALRSQELKKAYRAKGFCVLELKNQAKPA